MHSDGRSSWPRVLLVGQGPTAVTALQSLREHVQVVGVVRDPVEHPDEAADLARDAQIHLFTDTSIAGLEEAVAATVPDGVVVSSYNRVLPERLIDRPFVNVHYAPLPRYRGRAPVNWAILNGENCAAISIHVLAPRLDAGNVLFQQLVPVTGTTSVVDLYEQLNALQRQHLGHTVQRHLTGYQGWPQDEGSATYGCTRIPEDGEIDWTTTAVGITRLVRALSPPFPPAFTYLGGMRLEVLVAEPLSDLYEGRVPGRVSARSRADGHVDVLAGSGSVRLLVVRPDGGQPSRPADVITSVKATLGLRTSDLLRRVLQLEERVDRLLQEPAAVDGRRVPP